MTVSSSNQRRSIAPDCRTMKIIISRVGLPMAPPTVEAATIVEAIDGGTFSGSGERRRDSQLENLFRLRR
jgi:hypothetical protein